MNKVYNVYRNPEKTTAIHSDLLIYRGVLVVALNEEDAKEAVLERYFCVVSTPAGKEEMSKEHLVAKELDLDSRKIVGFIR